MCPALDQDGSADPELTFVPWESFAAESLAMAREEFRVYADVLPSGDPTIQRLLGHPDPVQGDMQLECQLAANGVYCGDASSSRDPRTARLRPGAADWRLLLQVDSQHETGMMWGDVVQKRMIGLRQLTERGKTIPPPADTRLCR